MRQLIGWEYRKLLFHSLSRVDTGHRYGLVIVNIAGYNCVVAIAYQLVDVTKLIVRW